MRLLTAILLFSPILAGCIAQPESSTHEWVLHERAHYKMTFRDESLSIAFEVETGSDEFLISVLNSSKDEKFRIDSFTGLILSRTETQRSQRVLEVWPVAEHALAPQMMGLPTISQQPEMQGVPSIVSPLPAAWQVATQVPGAHHLNFGRASMDTFRGENYWQAQLVTQCLTACATLNDIPHPDLTMTLNGTAYELWPRHATYEFQSSTDLNTYRVDLTRQSVEGAQYEVVPQAHAPRVPARIVDSMCENWVCQGDVDDPRFSVDGFYDALNRHPDYVSWIALNPDAIQVSMVMGAEDPTVPDLDAWRFSAFFWAPSGEGRVYAGSLVEDQGANADAAFVITATPLGLDFDYQNRSLHANLPLATVSEVLSKAHEFAPPGATIARLSYGLLYSSTSPAPEAGVIVAIRYSLESGSEVQYFWATTLERSHTVTMP